MKKLIQTLSPKKSLNMVILKVTSVCNSKCLTCYYWEELNNKGDLTLGEIEKISETMPSFQDLVITGGEPSLRPELPEIVNAFYKNNGIGILYFPTNGLKPKLIGKLIARILEENEALEVHVNISVDGLFETNDRLRGVPGNFDKSVETIGILDGIKTRFGNRLQINVNSVICTDNCDELVDLGEYFLDNHRLDFHHFQIIRGDPMDGGLKDVPEGKLRALYGSITRIQQVYSARQAEGRGFAMGLARKMAFVAVSNFLHITQFTNYVANKPWPMACTAGETTVTIEYDGRVRACEMRGQLGNIRDYGCDFMAFWDSEARKEEVNAIAGGEKCFCTHICGITNSLKFSTKAKFWELPKSYFNRLSYW